MDPFSLIASCIAVGQAIDRIGDLSSTVRDFFGAPEEILALSRETSDLRAVLRRLQSTTMALPEQDLVILSRILASCASVLSRLESLLQDSFITYKEGEIKETSAAVKFHRFKWVQKRREVNRHRQSLKAIRGLLVLHLVGLNSSFQGEIAVALSQFYSLVDSVLAGQSDLHEYLKETLGRLEYAILSSISSRSNGSSSAGTPAPRINQSLHLDVRESPESSRKMAAASCATECDCRCHAQSFSHQSSWHNAIGSLYISTTGSPFSYSSSCDHATCVQKSQPMISLVYYFPPWHILRSLGLHFFNGNNPRFTLSFPRTIAPDSKMAVCIRNGDYSGVRELLQHGEASPFDIIGPYGVSILPLAIRYGKVDICNLLRSQGAHLFGPHVAGCVWDVIAFWESYTVISCSLHSNMMIQDMVRSVSGDRYIDVVRQLGWQSGIDPESLPWLQKAVLGLTLESAEMVIRLSRAEINEVDSIGRTALHWAVCALDVHNVEQLLRCGADPNSCDRDGKSPLHIAAGLVDEAIVLVLISAGADLELSDAFGNTPLHPAAMQSHLAVITVLIKAGADLEAVNRFNETPLFSATLASQYRAVELLCEYGADTNHQCCWKYYAVHHAIQMNAYETIRVLLDRGCQTNWMPGDGKSLLHLAAQAADTRTMDLLTASNVAMIDVDSLDAKCYTARQYLEARDDVRDVEMAFARLELAVNYRMGRAKGVENMFSGAGQVGDDEDQFFDTFQHPEELSGAVPR